jgi:hypothetical protein
MIHSPHQFSQQPDLCRRQIFTLALGVAIDKVNAIASHLPLIDDPCAATFALPWQVPTEFAQARPAANQVTRIGRGEQKVL